MEAGLPGGDAVQGIKTRDSSAELSDPELISSPVVGARQNGAVEHHEEYWLGEKETRMGGPLSREAFLEEPNSPDVSNITPAADFFRISRTHSFSMLPIALSRPGSPDADMAQRDLARSYVGSTPQEGQAAGLEDGEPLEKALSLDPIEQPTVVERTISEPPSMPTVLPAQVERLPSMPNLRVGQLQVARPRPDLDPRTRALHNKKKADLISSLIRNNTRIGHDYGVHLNNANITYSMQAEDDPTEPPAGAYDAEDVADVAEEERVIPPLNIAILIVGTRGDVQPFVAIGRELKAHGHRVRLASHRNYREFVEENGLEFYPLGGDPKILAGYMVKNKGFLPSGPKEVKVQRKQLRDIIFSTYGACTQPDPGQHGAPPFVADAILANPPVYGHIHVAEKLRVPLHMFFTMPWTPTTAFPHPLARLNQITGFENKLSYAIVDTITWLGVRDIINSFRRKKLKLKTLTYTYTWSGNLVEANRVPFGYIWSPSLQPKPKDWGSHIDVVGFCFLDLAKGFTPPQDLLDFFAAGHPPVYIGFGSLPVNNPAGMTKIIFEALAKTGQRGIVQKGWGGLGEGMAPPPGVYLLDNCPHDWLFPRCAAVVHHGGAGTTAAGLRAECPTTVVPFFGDQPFWGDCVLKQGVGPKQIPVGDFSLDLLVAALEFMARPEVKAAAKVLAAKIRQEDGVVGAVRAFHKHLPRDVETRHEMKWGLERKRKSRFFACFGGAGEDQ